MSRQGAITTTPLTDLENARRFAEEHTGDLRYLGKSRQWLIWNGKRWIPDEASEVQRRAKETVRRFYDSAKRIKDSGERDKRLRYAITAQSAKRIGGMVDLAKSEPSIPITPDQLDTNPWLLNVENGTIDLRTGDLRKHRREDLITKLAPVAYDPSARCPTWDAFLLKIMGGE